MTTTSTRNPAVAGQFYPGAPEMLRTMVHRFIADSGVIPEPERTTAVMAPHAGYVYSGATAGHAYARVYGKRPGRVILLGCSHRYVIETAAIPDYGAFDTPLGGMPVDSGFARAASARLHAVDGMAHELEHSLEVQLPFLHEAVGAAPIVPILFGAPLSEWHFAAGRILAELAAPDDLVVISTDLSHYLPDALANEVDRRSLDLMLSQDLDAYLEGARTDQCKMCGAAAVGAGMAYSLARGALSWNLLDYRTSGAASGDTSHVVGYAAVSMEMPE